VPAVQARSNTLKTSVFNQLGGPREVAFVTEVANENFSSSKTQRPAIRQPFAASQE